MECCRWRRADVRNAQSHAANEYERAERESRDRCDEWESVGGAGLTYGMPSPMPRTSTSAPSASPAIGAMSGKRLRQLPGIAAKPIAIALISGTVPSPKE